MPETRAAYMRGYIKARRQYRRAQLIEMLGGRCVRCGSTDELEFDHIDPATKAFAVGSDMSRAWERLVEEALKCQLLCRPCHVTKGREDRPEPRHSYYRYWYYGCRCPICTEANAEKGRGQREKRGEKVGCKIIPDLGAAQHPRSPLPRPDSNWEPAG
jgi:hypothetical protein